MIKVNCLGGVASVTGSCFLIETGVGKSFMVDCGLFQGSAQIEQRNGEDWSFDPYALDTLLLTHAHIDHSGRIPKLVRDGFKGRIITSPPTAELCQIMLLDAAHVQEMDAEWQTRRNRRRARKPILPLYTMEDAEACFRYFSPVERDTIVTVDSGIKARLRNAGHILGSSILELWIKDMHEEIKIVFSGDIGQRNQLIVKDPDEIMTANYLFLESTYGNREHRSIEDSKTELLEAIRSAVTHGEKVIIPAFAVERTQEILYVLAEFHRNGTLPDIPVFLDSPLAIKATEIFRKNKQYYDEEALAIVDKGFDPFDMPNLRFTPTVKESMAINTLQGSAIVIAGNGMCTAGRIKHHLKHNLWRPGASIVFVGFQANGSTGRMIIEGRQWVKVFGENVAVRAGIFSIGGFSAHADQKDLLEWAGHFKHSQPQVFVVHGELTASEALARLIRERLSMEVSIPAWKELLILGPREVRSERAPVAAVPDIVANLHKTIDDLEAEINRLKGALTKKKLVERIGMDDVERLKSIHEELRVILSE